MCEICVVIGVIGMYAAAGCFLIDGLESFKMSNFLMYVYNEIMNYDEGDKW